jgi:hypothetical protein
MRWRNGLRDYATRWKVAGSIPDDVTAIFYLFNPSGSTTDLGSTQALTEMSARNISCWVKVAGSYGRQPDHLHVPNVLRCGSRNFLESCGSVYV